MKRRIKIKRLWNGLASVRDSVLNSCYKQGKDLVLVCDGQQMTIPNNKLLDKSFQISSKSFTSRYPNSPSYSLIDFKFTPDA
jgi:hypothetical protein